MKPAAHCAVPGSKKVDKNVVAPRTNRKDGPDRDVVLEIGRSVERINRNAKRRLGIERFGQRRFLGKNRSDRSAQQRAAHHFIGDDIDVLLPVAVWIDAAILPGNAGQWTVRDQGRQADRSGGDGRDHLAHRSAMRRQRSRSFEMRTQGRALVHDRLPASSSGRSQRGSGESANIEKRNLPNK